MEVVAGTVHEVVHMDVCPGLNIHVYVLDDGRREVDGKLIRFNIYFLDI